MYKKLLFLFNYSNAFLIKYIANLNIFVFEVHDYD